MKLLPDWRGYGYCTTCKANAQEPCKRRVKLWPCKWRESYRHYLERYARILSEHHGYTISPQQVKQHENGEIKL